jgi:2'-5' RNA ligase
MTDPNAPLILTLLLAPDAAASLERERRQHFPADRNVVPAHVSLFHHLPGTEHAAVSARLAEAAAATPRFPVLVEAPMLLGRGVAYRLRSEPLERLRAALAADWSAWLTAQDRQRFRPHVTIQNKAAPDAARTLHARLMQGFAPWDTAAHGLALWRYLGGPWEAAGRFFFPEA